MLLTTPNDRGLRAERHRGNERVEKEMEAQQRARRRNDAIKLHLVLRTWADVPPDWPAAAPTADCILNNPHSRAAILILFYSGWG